jgi:hypothetical protein
LKRVVVYDASCGDTEKIAEKLKEKKMSWRNRG